MINVELKGSKELAAAIRAAAVRAHDEVGQALYLEAEAVMAESKREVPVDEATLRNSGFVDLPTTRVLETSSAPSSVEVRLGYGGAASGYAVYLHEGTGPAVGRPAFFPPVAVIKEWVRRQLGVPADQLDSVAFLVARSIGRKGLRPRKFLEGPLKRRERGMAARMARRIMRRLEANG